MNPDANLLEQRELQKQISTSDAVLDREGYVDRLVRLAELAQQMDEWLSNGGNFPETWCVSSENAEFWRIYGDK